jgi:hypothetical protein
MFANGNLFIIILPLVALILAGLSVAGLWLWWDMTRGEDDRPAGRAKREETGSPEPRSDVSPGVAIPAEGASGGFLSKLMGGAEPGPSDAPPPSARPEQQSRSVPPPPPASPAPAAPPSAPSGESAAFSLSERQSRSVPLPGDAIEVFRIYRDLADGALIVEIHGQRYRSLGEITDAQVGRRFLGNVKALAHFARLGDVEIPDEWGAEAPPPPRGESAAFSQSEWQSRSVPPAQSSQPLPPPPPPPSPPAARPAESPSLLGGLFGRGAKPTEPEEEIDVRPMAEQIEELLQYRLTASPDLRHRSIHVRSAVDGGVRIEVDGRYYDGVGDVEDEDVREFIQSIIREWEARQ